MNSSELLRYLRKNGCTIEKRPGKGSHVRATRGKRRTTVPVHGARKELHQGLVDKILKDLGLK